MHGLFPLGQEAPDALLAYHRLTAQTCLQRDNQDENPASIRMRTRVWGHVGRA